MMKRFSTPMVLAACLLAGAQLGGCKSDKNYPDRMAFVRSQVAKRLALPDREITFSMSEWSITLSYPHQGGCEGMGVHGSKDCKETLAVCLTDDERCLDRYSLETNYSYTMPEYSPSLRMIIVATKYATEQHVTAEGSDLPLPQRGWADDIRLIGWEAYRLLPVLMQ